MLTVNIDFVDFLWLCKIRYFAKEQGKISKTEHDHLDKQEEYYIAKTPLIPIA